MFIYLHNGKRPALERETYSPNPLQNQTPSNPGATPPRSAWVLRGDGGPAIDLRTRLVGRDPRLSGKSNGLGDGTAVGFRVIRRRDIHDLQDSRDTGDTEDLHGPCLQEKRKLGPFQLASSLPEKEVVSGTTFIILHPKTPMHLVQSSPSPSTLPTNLPVGPVCPVPVCDVSCHFAES